MNKYVVVLNDEYSTQFSVSADGYYVDAANNLHFTRQSHLGVPVLSIHSNRWNTVELSEGFSK